MNVQAIIAAIVYVFCGSNADPGALIRIAQRESALKPQAWGDKKYGPAVYAKKYVDLVQSGNPWANDPSRWGGSFGLFQMMPAYFLRLWNAKADPFIMFDPRVSTVIAGRLWNRAVKAGARDFVEVRIFWAFGSLQHRQGSEEYNKRLDKWSVVDGVMNPPVSRFNYAGFGTEPSADQVQKVNAVKLTTQTQVEPKVATSWMPLLAVGALVYYGYKKGVFRRYATA